jgi:hypothetical protein
MKISTLLILALAGGIGYIMFDSSAKREAEEKVRAEQEAKIAQIQAELEHEKTRQAQASPATPPSQTPFPVHWKNPLDHGAYRRKITTP